MDHGEHFGEDRHLSTASSLADLVWLLARIRLRAGNPALRDIESRGKKLGIALPRATVADVLSGKRQPRLTLLLDLLRVLGVPETERRQWRAAWERAAENHAPLRQPQSRAVAKLPPHSANVDPAQFGASQPLGIGRLWTLDGRWPMVLTCGDLPPSMFQNASFVDPEDPDYVELYSYSDPDSLLELFGHIRASNPECEVRISTANRMQPSDYFGHLAILGGTDFNGAARDFISRLEMPIRMTHRSGGPESGIFETLGDSRLKFSPVLGGTFGNGQAVLIQDVALFFRGINPFNADCSVTVCAGIYARGTLAAVKASTDSSVREKNEAYIMSRFKGCRTFGILARAHVVNGTIMPPDWSRVGNVLYEWRQ
ncbi:hypothetical protein [Actinoplanes sp. NPDC049118]|uniref:hypothetical protein n=1 Tax=Actinoplanes sp. NPDC049118 TaxID=3155769 RepID=UPI0033E433D6